MANNDSELESVLGMPHVPSGLADSDGSRNWFWQLSREGCTVERRRD
jgi:hypothetical protein